MTLFTKDGCHLCEQTRRDLESLQSQVPHTLVEVDITQDPAVHKRYVELIPVVQVGAYTLNAPISAVDLKVSLMAAQENLPESRQISGGAHRRAVQANRWLHIFSRHWLAFFNLFVFIYVGLPFAAPTLMKAGAERPARWIYAAYSPLCHQFAFRSWFLFGEQSAYPRTLAGLELSSYGEATGLPENDTAAARAYLGNERLGYKVALCERDVAIYAGILVAGLFFGLVRTRLKPLPISLWLLLGIVPIALDGGSQLISGVPLFSFLPMRESTPFLRTLTGGLFGLMNVWLAYPYVQESMKETEVLLSTKLAAARAPSASAGND